MAKQAELTADLDTYQVRWQEMAPGAAPLRVPDYRVAASAVAVARAKATAVARGVWP